MIIRGSAKKETLENIVRTINSIIKNEDCYYTKEEIEKLKERERTWMQPKRKGF